MCQGTSNPCFWGQKAAFVQVLVKVNYHSFKQSLSVYRVQESYMPNSPKCATGHSTTLNRAPSFPALPRFMLEAFYK